MTKLSDLPAYQSRYLKAVDLKGKAWPMKIAKVYVESMKNFSGEMEEKGLITFQDARKPLILTKTNQTTLEAAFGDMENFVGKTVTLVAGRTRTGQETINIQVPQGAIMSETPLENEEQIDTNVNF